MKRKRTDWIRRAVSVLLTLILCAQAAGPILAVEDGVIRITCAEDLLELSRNCALDTWSQGKHVALTADISLAGTGYTPIPTFGGTFDGGGYTISGLDLSSGLTPAGAAKILNADARARKSLTGNGNLRLNVAETKRMYCAVIVPFRARILIPETEMWAENEERPAFVLRNMPGAQIDFVITHVDREAGFAIGSRRLALASRRYFFSTQPLHQPGSRVPCHVLAVGPRRCLVECYGYDVNLSQRDMSYAAIPDLREQYHPGDELTCVVKQFDRKTGSLEISVKESVPNPFDEASLRHPIGCRRRASIAGKYAGGVFCNLPDGAVVMCRYSFHYEDSDFKTGDTVMVVIQRYDEGKKQIFGKIVGR